MKTSHQRAVCAVAALIAVTGCRMPSAPAAPAGASSTALQALSIAAEDTGAHYDRDDWPHWSSLGGGCDTRDAVLRDQGHDVQVGPDCRITSGEWASDYDGVTVTDPSDLDIDHVVPLAEAARSGARTWTEQQREAYANDPAGLLAVTATSNRQKGDQDPAEWLPAHGRCDYARQWIEIKTRYQLSVDQAEHDVLAAVLERCR